MIRKLTILTAGMALTAAAWAGPSVEMQTSAGRIVIELNQEKAPATVKNFLAYAKDGFFNGTIFHRVIDGFMIQGGGFTQGMEQKPTRDAIINEGSNGLKNQRGTIAMARRADPNSATAQFFINHKDNPFLDHTGAPTPQGAGYAVFGKVSEGMDVVDKIAKVATANRGPHQNVPVEPVVIKAVKVISEK